jgi:signal transduction histidine kinase
MVAMVFGALILSGLASLALAAHSATEQTRKELVREAQGLAVSVSSQAETTNQADPAKALRNLLVALKSTLRLDGSAVLGVRADGRLYNIPLNRQAPALPTGLSAATIDPAALYRLETVSGNRAGLVFAAVPYQAQVLVGEASHSVVLVVVLTRRPPSALTSAGLWFAASALVILLLAGGVAWRLGRRFVRPIAAAQEVTSRIAAGDLAARVPNPAGTDPELAALIGSVNSMAAGLANAKAAERQFLQSVSHDLRTPLTAIRGFAEAIEDGAVVDVAAAAGVIASESRRLERLVGDLLGLATLEARRFTLQLRPVDLSAEVASAAAGFAPAAAELGLTISVEGQQAEPVGAVADPDRLAQVTANLIENALRYAAHEVRVRVRSIGGRAELSVQDDGPGIGPEELHHVFERLFVSRPRPDRPIGSGLGLAIVAELVSAMGGLARAESPLGPGGGTRMIVSLPGSPLPGPRLSAPPGEVPPSVTRSRG